MTIPELAYIDSTGYHFSDYPAFRLWLVGVYNGIYGADVYLGADSQDGQFISILAQAFYDTASLGAAVYNSFSPSTAQGTGLSRVVKINGLRRQSPSYSTVTVTIIGTTDTVITNGVVQDTLQQKWNLPTVVTIPDSGTIDVLATAQVIGAVFAEIATVNTIFTPTRGWQTVTNAAAATPGAPVELDSQLRIRQAISTANPSLTVLDGTIGAVANLDGVTKVRGYENDGETTDGDGLPAHSITIVTVGGDDTEIAEAIAIHKTPGTKTNGDTVVPVTDVHGMPLNIRFQPATTATIWVTITIAQLPTWSSDYGQLIKDSLAAVINAGNIGDDVIYTKLFGPAYLNGLAPGQTYTVVSIELKKNGGSFAPANVDLDFDEDPVCDPNVNVTLIIT